MVLPFTLNRVLSRVTRLPISWSLRLKPITKLSSILPQNVGPDLIFYRILHIVNNQDATLYQENFFVQLQKHTNTSQTWPPDVVIFVRKKSNARRWVRMEQSCLSFLYFYKRIILQSTGRISFLKASTYQNILVYRTYDIQSSRLPQFRRPNNLTSRRATKNILRSRARCEVVNDVTPKTYQNTTVEGGVRNLARLEATNSSIENQRNEEGSLWWRKAKENENKISGPRFGQKNEIVYISKRNRKNKKVEQWKIK